MMGFLELTCFMFNPHSYVVVNIPELNSGYVAGVVGFVGVGLLGLEICIWAATGASFERNLLNFYLTQIGGFFFGSLRITLAGGCHLAT
jgi:hypothetical protein